MESARQLLPWLRGQTRARWNSRVLQDQAPSRAGQDRFVWNDRSCMYSSDDRRYRGACVPGWLLVRRFSVMRTDIPLLAGYVITSCITRIVGGAHGCSGYAATTGVGPPHYGARHLLRFLRWIEGMMKRPPGSPRPDRACSASRPVSHSDRQLHAALATLEHCRAVLIASASQETAQLVSMAILQLRMKLNRITDAEWKALCDAVTADRSPGDGSQAPTSPPSRRRRPSALHS